MKFKPKTQDEIDTENLLPDGAYDAEITSAVEKSSKKGNPMIEVNLKVFTNDGGCRYVYDWLLEAVPHKLLHCAESLGLLAEYQAGEIRAELLEGKGTAILIGQSPASGNYRASNKVLDYLTAEELKNYRSRHSTGGTSSKPENDDIPF